MLNCEEKKYQRFNFIRIMRCFIHANTSEWEKEMFHLKKLSGAFFSIYECGLLLIAPFAAAFFHKAIHAFELKIKIPTELCVN